MVMPGSCRAVFERWTRLGTHIGVLLAAAADDQPLRELFQAVREPRPTKNLLDPSS
jgi:hypothetical protein